MDRSVDYLQIDLANILMQCFRNEFQNVFLSRNLVRTMRMEICANGSVKVHIPAQMYDINLFRKSGVVVHNYINGASYADDVNETGGFSGKHVGYVNRCVDKAIAIWAAKNNIKYNQVSKR